MAASDVTTIRAAEPSDAAGIAAIYNHYVAQSIVTFEEEPVSDAEIARAGPGIGSRRRSRSRWGRCGVSPMGTETEKSEM